MTSIALVRTIGERLPNSRLFWGCLLLGGLLWALGWVLWVGPLAGILGVLGISCVVTAIVGYGGYWLWYTVES
ncbi:hypothetical protein [Halocatena halophila]|uniref:hypothetical protein n=1 Tax=Halocatena halophila TaxID=2814576 RepID=UPI002ED023FE